MSKRGRLAHVAALLLATFSVVMACSDEPSPSEDTGRIGSGKVGAAGGVVASNDGTTAKIEIPSGALNSESEITIAKVPDAQAPQVTGTVSAGATLELGPEGIAFQQPVRVIIAFDPTKRPAGAAELPTIFTAQKGAPASAFVAMPTVSVDSTHVATTTTHFSWWTPVFVLGAEVDAGTKVEAADADVSDARPEASSSDDDAESGSDSGSDGGSDSGTDSGSIPGSCVPTTCLKQGTECGLQGDGCGGLLDCGQCASPDTCGGGGAPSKCGGGDSGSSCTPKSCAELGINCGNAGDGCGHLIACGTCPYPRVCGNAAVFGQCVDP